MGTKAAPTRRRRSPGYASTATAGGLAAAAAVHAAWAAGSTWPRRSADQLADLVVGVRPFPSSGASAVVAMLLCGAAISVAAAERRDRLPASLDRPVRWTTGTVAGALLARGAGGLVVSGLGLMATTAEFRRWDLSLYSPLCLALGFGARHALAASRGRSEVGPA